MVLTDKPDVNNIPPWDANRSLTSLQHSMDKAWSLCKSSSSFRETLSPTVQGTLINSRQGASASLSYDWAMWTVFLLLWLTLPNPEAQTQIHTLQCCGNGHHLCRRLDCYLNLFPQLMRKCPPDQLHDYVCRFSHFGSSELSPYK